PVRFPTGDAVLDLRFAYSTTTPRLEIIQSIPGTLWVPAADSGVHHLGYWSDDVAADAATLEQRGFTTEVLGARPDGTVYWAYHRRPGQPRIELVTRDLQPTLERYWSEGRPG
ncbi:MAG: VOC family protein, partial [Actinomycetota bacterium]